MPDTIGPGRSVIWVYGKSHLEHPFMVLSIDSLLAAGCEVTIIDARGAPEGAAYSGFADYDPRPGAAKFNRVVDFTRVHVDGLRQRTRDSMETSSRASDWRSVVQQWRSFVVLAVLALFRIALRVWRGIRLHLISKPMRHVKAAWHLLRRPCDVIVASRPPECFFAYAAARLRGKRFVYYPFELYGSQHSRASRVAVYLEKMMLRLGVDALITQNSHRANVYRQRGAKIEPVIVRNFKPFRRATGGAMRRALGLRPDQRIVLYEGGLMPGRWLDNLSRASLLFRDDTVLVMLGNGNAWWNKNAGQFVDAPQQAGRLIVANAVPHDVLLDYVADADVGVIIYDDAVLNNVYCEPGKLSDYVHAMVPVIAPDFPTIAPLVRELGVGVCFRDGSPQAIADAVHAVLEKGRQAWQPSLAGAAGRLDWSTQSGKLISAIAGGADQPSLSVSEPPAPRAAHDRAAQREP